MKSAQNAVHPPVVDIHHDNGEFSPAPIEHDILLGFDGFIDTIYSMVDTRTGPQSYERMESLYTFGERITDSASRASSLTVEWESESMQPGGFTIHCGDALAALGADVVQVGTYGRPIEQIFSSLTGATDLISVGKPTKTKAVEFDDNKLILIDSHSQLRLDWSTLIERAGYSTLRNRMRSADIMGVGTWGKIPQMPTIWGEMKTALLEKLADPPSQIVIDLGNIRMLPPSAIRTGVDALAQLNQTVPVTLTGNRGEIDALAKAVSNTSFESFLAAAAAVRDTIEVEHVVGHNAEAIVMCTPSSKVTISPPKISAPTRLLSAGDRFNAGLIYGLLAGLSGESLLALADLVARYYIQTGQSPTYSQLCQVLRR